MCIFCEKSMWGSLWVTGSSWYQMGVSPQQWLSFTDNFENLELQDNPQSKIERPSRAAAGKPECGKPCCCHGSLSLSPLTPNLIDLRKSMRGKNYFWAGKLYPVLSAAERTTWVSHVIFTATTDKIHYGAEYNNISFLLCVKAETRW